MAEEDFYVTFGSNASAWAQGLRGQLDPAYREIQKLQAAINGLQRNMTTVSGPLAKALTQALPESVAGTRTGVTPQGSRTDAVTNQMMEHLLNAGSELDHIMSGLQATFTALRAMPTAVETAITGMENRMAATLRSFNSTVSGLTQVGQGRGREYLPGVGTLTPSGTGGIQHGSPVHQFIQETRDLLTGGLLDVRAQPAPPQIAAVSPAAIDQAGVDRIINAIQEQTRELISKGVGVRTGRRATAPAEETDVQTGEVLPQTQKSVAQARAELEQMDRLLAGAIAGLGDHAVAADQALVAKLRQARDTQAAEVARMEREQEGVTRPQQQAARQQGFAAQQAQMEEVTREEKQARLQALELIKQAQAPDFLENIGRGKTQYGMTDLRRIADALKTAGDEFAISGVTRKRMPDLAQQVAERAQAYGQQYPLGTYPDALNPRVRVAPGPAVSPGLQAFLGEMNQWVEAIRAQRVNARTGGDIPRQPGVFTPQPATIQVPPGTTKGRLGVGGGILDVPNQEYFASVGLEGRSVRPGTAPTSADLARIRDILKDPYAALGAQVRQGVRDPNWDPYNQAFQSGVGTRGKSEEAAAARLYLGSLRRATDQLDGLADEYEALHVSIGRNLGFIERANERIARGTPKPTDVEKIGNAEFQVQAAREKIAATDPELRALFGEQGYQEGRLGRNRVREQIRARQTGYDDLLAGDTEAMSPATRYELAESARNALIGRRAMIGQTGQATDEFIRSIPGAVSRTTPKGQPSIGSAEGMSKQDQEKLDNAFSKWATAISRLARMVDAEGKLVGDASPQKLEEAVAHEENSAVGLIRQIDRLFSNSALTVERLIGRDLEQNAPRLPSAQGRNTGVDQRIEAALQGTATEAERAERAAKAERQAKREATAATESEVKFEAQKASITKEVVAATNAEIAAKREELSALRAAGPYTKGQIKELTDLSSKLTDPRSLGAQRAAVTRATNRGDTEGAATAQARLDERLAAAQTAQAALQGAVQRRAEITRVSDELNAMKKAAGIGGAGGGGTTPPTARGGAGGGEGDDSVLRQILAELKRITAALKGTLRVTGRNITSESAGTTTGTTATTTPRVRPTMTRTQAQEEAASLTAAARERRALADIERGKQRIRQEDERRIRILQQEDAAATRAEVEEARRLQGLQLAMSRLSAATQAEVQRLRELHAAAAPASQIVAQQQRVYGSLSADLERQGIPAAGRDAAARAVLNDAGPTVDTTQLSEIKRQSELVGQQAAQGATEAAKTFFGPQGFWGRIINTTGTFVVRNFAAGAVFGLTNQLQQITEQAIQTEATFVRVSSALEATGKDVGNLRTDLGNISTDYGVQLNDVYETAAQLTGLFSNSQDLAAGTRVVAQLQAISEGALNANEAVGVLASTMSAFEGSDGLRSGAAGLQQIADVFTTIQNNLGVNIEDTAEGVSRLAGQARQLNLSFEETSVFVAQIAKQTNQTGAGAGEQLSRILASLQTGRARTAISQNFGPGVNQAIASGQYGQALEKMIGQWHRLNDAQKGQVALAIAGQRQSASFFALMNGGANTLELLAKAHDSTGAAQRRMDAIMQTLNKRLEVFRTELVNLASNLVRTGILNFLGVMLVVTNKVLDVINKVLEAFNKFADSNPFIGFLRTSITLLGGAALSMKLLGASVAGLREAMAARTAGTAVSALGEGSLIAGGAGGLTTGAAVGAAAEQRAMRSVPTFGQYGVQAARIQGAPIAEGRQNAQLTRMLGFTLDRTIGTAATTYANGLSAASKKMMASSNEFVRTMGVALARDAEALAGATGSLRTGLQGAGSGALGPGGILRRGANSLDARAQSAFANAASLRSQYETGRQSYFDALESGGTAIHPDPAMLRQAEAADRMGRSLSRASTFTGKVSSGFERIAQSGALADGALIAVGVGLSAFITYLENSKKAAQGVSDALEALKPENAHLTADQIRQRQYIGPSQDVYDTIFRDRLEAAQAPGLGGAEGKFQLGLQGLGGILSDPHYIMHPVQGLARAFGTSSDLSQTYGLDRVNAVLNPALAQLQSMGRTSSSDAVLQVQTAAQKQLDDLTKQIASDSSTSQQQKIAALAAIDQARKQLGDEGSAALKSAEGLSKVAQLSDDQIQQLQTALQFLQSTGGRTDISGINLSGLYSQLQDNIGASGKLDQQVSVLMQGNLTAVDQQIQVRRILKTEIRNLQAKLQSQLSAGSNASTDDISATETALESAVGQLQQIGNTLPQTILQNGQQNAQMLIAEGRYAAAMRVYAHSMGRANHQFQVDAGRIGGAVRELVVSYSQITRAAGVVDRDIDLASRAGEYAGYSALVGSKRTGLGRQLHQQLRQQMVQAFAAKAQAAMDHAVAGLDLEIAQAAGNAERVAMLTLQRDRLVRTYTENIHSGQGILPPGITRRDARKYGNAAVSLDQVNQADQQYYQSLAGYQDAQQQAADTAAQDAATARQNAAALRQAQLGVAQAWAEARGDAVASARVQVQMAAAQIAAAKAELGAATDASSRSQALASLYEAQAQMIAAHAAVAQAQADLISSRYDVSIALAEAAGHTVEAARRRMEQANAALQAALRRSGGRDTAEVNQARASAIQAEAAVRDAKLQDELDTINFNLEMGRITQSSAINALRHILQTEELTKAQRRQLLLQIKGMKDELADSQWNFGDIKLPTPYQMRRYIEARRGEVKGAMDAAVAASNSAAAQVSAGGGGGVVNSNNTTTNTFIINGADTEKVRKIIKDEVGGNARVRTTGARRGR